MMAFSLQFTALPCGSATEAISISKPKPSTRATKEGERA
jgi:hypothetical protein